MPLPGTVEGAGQIDSLGHTIQQLTDSLNSQGHTIQQLTDSLNSQGHTIQQLTDSLNSQGHTIREQDERIDGLKRANTSFKYYLGWSFIGRSEEFAINSFKAAVEDGYLPAIYPLAACYDHEKNFGEAIKYYVEADKQKHPHAAYSLGLLYEECCDDGIQDVLKAREWYTKSVEKYNHLQACVRLGLLIERGSPDDSDKKEPSDDRFNKASELYKRSADGDIADGQYNYARCLEISMQRLEDPDQESQLLEKVRNLYSKAAGKKHIPATMRLGLSYQLGIGNDDSINSKQAMTYYNSVRLLTRRRCKGISDVYFNAGMLYLKFPQYTNVPYVKAEEMLAFAAAEDHVMAIYHLGELYERDLLYSFSYGNFQEDTKPKDRALSCYKQAYGKGYVSAIYKIFDMYKNSYDYLEKKHKEDALVWLQKAVYHCIPGANEGLAIREKLFNGETEQGSEKPVNLVNASEELPNRGIKRNKEALTIFGTRDGGGAVEKRAKHKI